MRILQSVFVAIIVCLLVFGLVFASIPYPEAIRWLVSVPAWIFGTAAVLCVGWQIRSVPMRLRPLTSLAVIGWIAASVAVAVIASFLFAVEIEGKDNFPPQYWILCRGVLAGCVFAVFPAIFVFWSARRGIPEVGHAIQPS